MVKHRPVASGFCHVGVAPFSIWRSQRRALRGGSVQPAAQADSRRQAAARGLASSLGIMIFVAETEERALYVFPGEKEAIANCEGLDVEAAVWLFWDDAGRPLEPLFTIPNKRGFFGSKNGVYVLVPAAPNHHAVLDEAIEEILTFEAEAPFNSMAGVRAHIESLSGRGSDA